MSNSVERAKRLINRLLADANFLVETNNLSLESLMANRDKLFNEETLRLNFDDADFPSRFYYARHLFPEKPTQSDADELLAYWVMNQHYQIKENIALLIMETAIPKEEVLAHLVPILLAFVEHFLKALAILESNKDSPDIEILSENLIFDDALSYGSMCAFTAREMMPPHFGFWDHLAMIIQLTGHLETVCQIAHWLADEDVLT
jgi:hypothetical protein